MFAQTAIFRPVMLLLSGLMLFTISMAVLNTLIPLWMERSALSTVIISIAGSCYFVGNLIGALIAGKIIKHWGFNKSYYFACVLFAVSTIGLNLSIHYLWWSALRLFAGIACAMVWVIVESALLRMGDKPHRGTLLAAYMIVYYLGTVCGQLLLNLVPTASSSVLPWSSLLFLIAIIPMMWATITQAKSVDSDATHCSLRVVLRRQDSKLSVIGCVISGIILGSLYTLLPLYLSHLGYTDSQVASWLALLVSAGIIGQFPVGKFSDKYGRRIVLQVLSMLIFLAAIMVFIDRHLLGIALFLLGCASFTLYPVAMAWGCEKVEQSELVAMNQLLLLSYTVGSIIGPTSIAILMQSVSDNLLFIVIAFVDILFLILLFSRMKYSPDPLSDDQHMTY